MCLESINCVQICSYYRNAASNRPILLTAERSAREKKLIIILYRKPPKYNTHENAVYSLTVTFKYKSYDKT